MTAQAKHYRTAGDNLMAQGKYAEAERAFRAAQNHLEGRLEDFKPDFLMLQEKIVAALEAQQPGNSARALGSITSPKKAKSSKANGAKSKGRPRLVRNYPDEALGLSGAAIDSMDWIDCYPVLDSIGRVVGVVSALSGNDVLAGKGAKGHAWDEEKQGFVPA